MSLDSSTPSIHEQMKKAVKERETEFSDYKKKHEELPKRLEKAIKEAEHKGTAIIELIR